MDANRFHVSPGARPSISPDGLVILDVHGGDVLASNSIGARIWELLASGLTRDEIASRLAAEYQVPVERVRPDVTAFVAALLARGLLVEAPDGKQAAQLPGEGTP